MKEQERCYFVCWSQHGFNKSYNDQPGIMITQNAPGYSHVVHVEHTLYRARKWVSDNWHSKFKFDKPLQCHPVCLMIHKEYGIGCEFHFGTFEESWVSHVNSHRT